LPPKHRGHTARNLSTPRYKSRILWTLCRLQRTLASLSGENKVKTNGELYGAPKKRKSGSGSPSPLGSTDCKKRYKLRGKEKIKTSGEKDPAHLSKQVSGGSPFRSAAGKRTGGSQVKTRWSLTESYMSRLLEHIRSMATWTHRQGKRVERKKGEGERITRPRQTKEPLGGEGGIHLAGYLSDRR